MARWFNLPPSEQHQQFLASTTTAVFNATTTVAPRKLGPLLRQEIAENGQILCHYRNRVSDSPLPMICDLGCCDEGCCSIEGLAQAGPSYEWAVAMLVVILVTLVAAMICMFGLYVYNRIRDQRQRERILGSSSLRSSSISQISGPTLYSQDVFYPYHTAKVY
ncbi:Protein F21E9.2 [Aphelenchoides avenae]|nr:Protein F21E9.2 [Aphelenchus avenae]